MPATAKKLHWTQRPEYRERLLNRGKRKEETKPTLISEHEQLLNKIKTRLDEIDGSIDTLKKEKEDLQKLLNIA